MTDARDWKATLQSAMYECPELRQKKVHRDLLGFILFKANRKSKSCWVSQKEMARVQGCSIRNIKELLRDLQGIGVLMQVRFSALPLKDQEAINSISPREMSKNSNVYFLSLGWAKDVLDEGRVDTPRGGEIRISEQDRKRGRNTSNGRRQRYAPIIRADEAAERRRTERRAKCSKERVTRMEEAFHWVLAHVGKPEHRKVLLAYAEVKARGWQWDRYLQNRNRRNPTENAWVKRTVQRWIVLSLQEIADNIPKRDILLPTEPDLLLAQIEGESPCKSIRSDLRSWMSPDGKPSYRRTM